MEFGISFANTGIGSTPDGTVALAQAAEAAGFTTLWAVEHVVVPSGYESKYPYDPSGKMAGGAEEFDLPDPLVWMTWVAANTTALQIGTGILIAPQRNPVITAKEVATIDRFSGGRVRLGVGIGWLREEFDAIGVPWTDRARRLEDHVAAMRALWTEDVASYHGTYVNFDKCIVRPQPVRGTVPIVIGGHSEAAAQRAGRIGDGFYPGTADTEALAPLITLMRRTAEEAGRDPNLIPVYAGGSNRPGPRLDARIEALLELGVTQMVVPPASPERIAELGADLVGRYG